MWKLGQHLLVCGDCTDSKVIERVTEGKKVDLVVTDPPYGMKKKSVEGDNMNSRDLLEFGKMWIPMSFKVLKDNGSWYCWGNDTQLMDIYADILRPMIADNICTLKNLITWDKGAGQGQLSNATRQFARADEKALFVMMGVQEASTNADHYYEGWEPIRKYLDEEMRKCGGSKNWHKALGNQMGKHYFTRSQWLFPTDENYKKLQDFGQHYGAFRTEYETLRAEWYASRAFFDNLHDNMNNVWHFLPTSRTERALCGGHETPKPVALCERCVKSSSREGETVLDLFGGSGSVLVACERTRRKCRMIELMPKWCDVIVHRYEYITGERAKLIRG